MNTILLLLIVSVLIFEHTVAWNDNKTFTGLVKQKNAPLYSHVSLAFCGKLLCTQNAVGALLGILKLPGRFLTWSILVHTGTPSPIVQDQATVLRQKIQQAYFRGRKIHQEQRTVTGSPTAYLQTLTCRHEDVHMKQKMKRSQSPLPQ